jgi:hypothetical protein
MKNVSSVKLLSAATLLLLAGMFIAPVTLAQDIIPVSSVHAATDTTPPSDVEGVKAIGGNATVDLSWNVATDDTAVKGYKIYYGTTSVSEDGATYEKAPIDAGNKITYQVGALTNGTAYFFAVTAYDEAGNESENYSSEVSATPAHAAADTDAPKVVKALATNKVAVKVTFSEAVTIPLLTPESAFSIKNDSTQSALDVKKAQIDPTDASNKTVLLETGAQAPGANYIVTAGIDIKDGSGNPIISGTSDTAVFAGSDIEPIVLSQTQVVQADTTGPSIINVVVPNATTVKIDFSEAVKLSSDPLGNFVITEEDAIENTLDVMKAVLSADEKSVVLQTAKQSAMNYNLIVIDVLDKAGNLISVDNNATVFFGGVGADTSSTQEPQVISTDTAAPEDATDLKASLLEKTIVRLVWMASKNTALDLSNYVLYKGTDGKTYDAGQLIDAAASNYDFSNLVPGMKYYFKLTAKDAVGNESAGITTTFTLPATGPELGLLLFSSLGLGKLLSKKKKGGKKGRAERGGSWK